MAALIPVIIPRLSIKKQYNNFVFDLSELTNVFEVYNEEEFLKIIKDIEIRKITKESKLSEKNKKKLDEEIGNSDGRSGERLKNFIEKELQC